MTIMGNVHEFITQHGSERALKLYPDEREVLAANGYMFDENNAIGFLYAGWAQAALPHRKLPDAEGWQTNRDWVTLVVEPGMRPTATGKPEMIGVPYGSRARLIMFYLQSEAMRTGSREIELGGSLRAWLSRMGISAGGKSIDGVRDQAERISRCRITLQVRMGQATGLINQNIVDSAIFLDNGEARQSSLFAETARLSEGFFHQLQNHALPLQEAAIRHINNNSMALDLYAWLAYRLHVLEKPIPIRWAGVKQQFGNGFARMSHFKDTFTPNLRLALAVYPEAKVEMTDEGLLLYPSPPPVPAGKVPTQLATRVLAKTTTRLAGKSKQKIIEHASEEAAKDIMVVGHALQALDNYSAPQASHVQQGELPVSEPRRLSLKPGSSGLLSPVLSNRPATLNVKRDKHGRALLNTDPIPSEDQLNNMIMQDIRDGLSGKTSAKEFKRRKR